MVIDDTNYQVGNKAMASILLLYYHLLSEGGISNDQTVYIDPNDFNGFDFLNVELQESKNQNLDINENLIKEGAIIYLLCDLNDLIGNYDENYNSQPYVKKIINALSSLNNAQIPEVTLLLNSVSVPETEFNYSEFNEILKVIYKKYVYDFFKHKLS